MPPAPCSSLQFCVPPWVFKEMTSRAENLSPVLSRHFCAHPPPCLDPEGWSPRSCWQPQGWGPTGGWRCCLPPPDPPQPQASPIYTSVHSAAPSPTWLSSVLHFLLLLPPWLCLSPCSHLRHGPGPLLSQPFPPAPKVCVIAAHAAGSGSGSGLGFSGGGCGAGNREDGARVERGAGGSCHWLGPVGEVGSTRQTALWPCSLGRFSVFLGVPVRVLSLSTMPFIYWYT